MFFPPMGLFAAGFGGGAKGTNAPAADAPETPAPEADGAEPEVAADSGGSDGGMSVGGGIKSGVGIAAAGADAAEKLYALFGPKAAPKGTGEDEGPGMPSFVQRIIYG